MAREHQKTADRHRTSAEARTDRRRDDRHSGDGSVERGGWYGGERENEFGGEGRFRAEGAAHGSHFGGEPEALRDGNESGEQQNTRAWLGERRRKFVEKFERWRSERAARAAKERS